MASSANEPDMELKKAFIELQQKMQSTHQALRISELQINSLKRQIAVSKVTDKAVECVPGDTPLYSGVGRMFVLSERNKIRHHLTNTHTKASQKIQTIEKNMQYLNKCLKDSENNLREMVKQKQTALVG